MIVMERTKNSRYWCIRIFVMTVCVAILGMFMPDSARAYVISPYDDSGNVIEMPQKIVKYVEDNVADAVETVLEDGDSGVDMDYGADISIVKPYVIYNAFKQQDAVYNFPLTADDRVVMVISVMDTEEGLGMQFGPGLADKLNEIDYVHTDYIFYEYDDTFYAESANAKMVLGYISSGNYNYTDEEMKRSQIFSRLSYMEKCRVIADKVKDFVKCTVSEDGADQNLKAGGILTLHNPMGQYNYGMCWAACVATVVNYKKNSSVNPFEVCNKMSIGYDEGGTAYNIRDALNKYSVDYQKVRFNMLNIDEVKDNIDGKHPIVALLFNDHYSKGHAVVIFGYTPKEFLKYWDPAISSTGGEGTIEYVKSSYNFVSNGHSYEWRHTVSKK